MNCQSIIIGAVPILFLISIGHYFLCRMKAGKLNAKIITNINNVWSGHGGKTQVTEVAALANRLTEKMNNNPSIITSFGLASMILTALVTTIYTLSQINSNFCSVQTNSALQNSSLNTAK